MTCERLAILVHDLSLGGTERIAIRLANEWAAEGRRVDVICGDLTGPLRKLVSDKLRLILPPSPIERGLGSRAKLGGSRRRMLRASDRGIVHSRQLSFLRIASVRRSGRAVPAGGDCAVE